MGGAERKTPPSFGHQSPFLLHFTHLHPLSLEKVNPMTLCVYVCIGAHTANPRVLDNATPGNQHWSAGAVDVDDDLSESLFNMKWWWKIFTALRISIQTLLALKFKFYCNLTCITLSGLINPSLLSPVPVFLSTDSPIGPLGLCWCQCFVTSLMYMQDALHVRDEQR